MKRAIVYSFCDIAKRHNGELVPATHEDTQLAWEGRRVELDLCDTCYDVTAQALGALMAIGHASGKVGTSREGMDRRTNEYYTRLAAWCDERGIKHGSKAGFKISVKREFDKWEADMVRGDRAPSNAVPPG
jgi:hypothetical protein